jgi:putative membrane protein (TIGR04086 family)
MRLRGERPMRPISLRAMLVANAVQTAAAFVIFVTACLAALGIAWCLAGFPADIDPITHQLKTSSLFLSALTTITVLPSSLIGGYVAGRIAGSRPVLHGALSGVLWIILLICVALALRRRIGRPMTTPIRVRPRFRS